MTVWRFSCQRPFSGGTLATCQGSISSGDNAPGSGAAAFPRLTSRVICDHLFARLIRGLLSALLATLGIGGAAVAENVVLVRDGSTWRYLADDADPGRTWLNPAFMAVEWPIGRAPLGYGDGDEETLIPPPASGPRPVATYFHRVFTVADPERFTMLLLRLIRDDGAVVYLNGTEIGRSNMGGGPVDYQVPALTATEGRDEGGVILLRAPSSALVEGRNVLAVEIHQATTNSPDLSFDCELVATTSEEPAFVIRGPYLQDVTPDGLTIRWRTDVPTASSVHWGKQPLLLPHVVTSEELTTEHEMRLTGRSPDSRHFYAIGDGVEILAGGDRNHWFRTQTLPGVEKPLRVWVIGDSGTGGDGTGRAEAVRNAYRRSPLYRHPNVWLMLGDNAYGSGTDAEYQSAVFDTYRKLLPNTPLWPTIGNHETYSGPTIPYFNIFTLPTKGEAGGLPSGTERYYSFDQGTVHFVCLDSMTSNRLPGSPMLTWLENDLAATTQRWVIAYWHHPPYSRGSHNSDIEGELVEMRQHALPILERHGVDLVLSGHSHSYERSFLIDGHYGTSDTLNPSMIRNQGDGQENGGGAYVKFTRANAGAVYTVCGVSGQVGGGTFDHPIMVKSLATLGSMILDIAGDRLEARFIDSTGVERDQFTMVKPSIDVQP